MLGSIIAFLRYRTGLRVFLATVDLITINCTIRHFLTTLRFLHMFCHRFQPFIIFSSCGCCHTRHIRCSIIHIIALLLWLHHWRRTFMPMTIT
ncbi:hypothetical protein PVAP13_7NG050117 [Panicum virgatum]|uniref:Uncharacterized protein n=1 Tax=Panicum virgatum TaxID=38727 RepID=A0A8T0PWC3_PANVG|nr:hypothetical protein PVAP13_7NG050117 [Panicum virgatum]